MQRHLTFVAFREKRSWFPHAFSFCDICGIEGHHPKKCRSKKYYSNMISFTFSHPHLWRSIAVLIAQLLFAFAVWGKYILYIHQFCQEDHKINRFSYTLGIHLRYFCSIFVWTLCLLKPFLQLLLAKLFKRVKVTNQWETLHCIKLSQ